MGTGLFVASMSSAAGRSRASEDSVGFGDGEAQLTAPRRTREGANRVRGRLVGMKCKDARTNEVFRASRPVD